MTLVAITIVLAGCSTANTETPDISGVWVLESFSEDGTTKPVEVGVNAANQPWIQIADDVVAELGCNDFRSFDRHPYTYDDGILFIAEGLMSATACAGENGDLMKTDDLLSNAIRAGARARREGDQMTWTFEGAELSFQAVAEPPKKPEPRARTSIGALDCTPDVVGEERIVDAGADTLQVLLDTVPDVSWAEQDTTFAPGWPQGWFWLGYDKNDIPIAFIARGDIEPPEYLVYTCMSE